MAGIPRAGAGAGAAGAGAVPNQDNNTDTGQSKAWDTSAAAAAAAGPVADISLDDRTVVSRETKDLELIRIQAETFAKSGNFTEAMRLYTEAASGGHKNAGEIWLKIGRAYTKGSFSEGVFAGPYTFQDIPQAIKAYEQAWMLGWADAALSLGILTAKTDMKKATIYYRQASMFMDQSSPYYTRLQDCKQAIVSASLQAEQNREFFQYHASQMQNLRDIGATVDRDTLIPGDVKSLINALAKYEYEVIGWEKVKDAFLKIMTKDPDYKDDIYTALSEFPDVLQELMSMKSREVIDRITEEFERWDAVRECAYKNLLEKTGEKNLVELCKTPQGFQAYKLQFKVHEPKFLAFVAEVSEAMFCEADDGLRKELEDFHRQLSARIEAFWDTYSGHKTRSTSSASS